MSIISMAGRLAGGAVSMTGSAAKWAYDNSGANEVPVLRQASGSASKFFKRPSWLGGKKARPARVKRDRDEQVSNKEDKEQVKRNKDKDNRDRNREENERVKQQNEKQDGTNMKEVSEDVKVIRHISEGQLKEMKNGNKQEGSVMTGLLGAIAGLAGMLGTKGLLGTATTLLKGISGRLMGLLGATTAGTFLKGAVGKAKGLYDSYKASKIGPKAPSKLSTIARDGKEKLVGAVTNAKDKAGDLLKTGKDKVTTIADAAKTRGAGLLDAAKSKAGALKDKTVEVAKAGKGKAAGMLASAAGLFTGGAVAETATKTVGEAAAKTGEKTAAKGIGKGLGKSVLKKIPGVGLLMGLGLAAERIGRGDWLGAGLETVSGIASTFPGVGTGVSLALDGAIIGRDVYNDSTNPTTKTVETAEGKVDRMVSPTNPDLQRANFSPASENDNNPVAMFKKFLSAGLDETKGIVVRAVYDPLKDRGQQDNPVTQTSYAPSSATPSPNVAPSAPRSNPIAPSVAPNSVGRRGAGDDLPVKPLARAPRSSGKRDAIPTTELANSPLGHLIARGEGDYNSYNAGTKHTGGKVKISGKKDLSSMTINDIINSSETKRSDDKDRVFAAGRYQIITPTLKRAVKEMKLKGDEKFTPEMQDRIFQEFLLPKPVRNYITGKSDDLQGAQIGLAKEWRSFTDPRTGKTYADAGAGANHASISAAESAKSLQDTRAKVMAQAASPTTGDTVREAGKDAKTVNVTVVNPPAAPAPAPQGYKSGSGANGLTGGLGTRNTDSTISRLTDSRIGYGMV